MKFVKFKDLKNFLHKVEGGSKGSWTPPQNSRGGPGPPDPPWSEAHEKGGNCYLISVIKSFLCKWIICVYVRVFMHVMLVCLKMASE